MKQADIIVPGGPQNKTAIDFIVENLHHKLVDLGIASEAEKLDRLEAESPGKETIHPALDEEMLKKVVLKLHEADSDMK